MPDAHVVRTAWIYAGGAEATSSPSCGGLAAGDGPVDVVADQIGSPTYVGDLVGALLQVADDGSIRESVLHAANEGAVSRFDQARAVFETRRRRPGPGPAGRHRPASPPRAAAGVLGACPHGDPPRRA